MYLVLFTLIFATCQGEIIPNIISSDNGNVIESDLQNGLGASIVSYKNKMIIGAPYGTANGVQGAGSVYIYENNSTTKVPNWYRIGNLTSNDPYLYESFGWKLDFYNNTIIVRPFQRKEIVYVFKYNLTKKEWYQHATLSAPTNSDVYYFGYDDIGLSKLENRIFVSARNPYSVFVFDLIISYDNHSESFDDSQSKWIQTAHLTAENANATYFGSPLAIGNNGNLIFVGGSKSDGYADGGIVFVYEYNINNNSEWIETDILSPSPDNHRSDDIFGYSISMDWQNKVAIIGSTSYVADQNVSKGYIFGYNAISRQWIETSILQTPKNSDESGNVYYDITVDIMNDYAVIGANSPYANFGRSSTGEAHVFKYNLTRNNWQRVALLKPNDGYWVNFADCISIGITDSIDNYTYVSIGSGGLVHTKSAWIFNLDAIDNNEYPLAMEIDYNYNTNLEMILLDNYNSTIGTGSNSADNVIYQVDECSTSDETWWNLGGFNIWSGIYDGCYQITFSDCDDSLKNDRTDDHGSYTIMSNGIIVGYGGYYSESETHTICVNNHNHVSYCITPAFCRNNSHLWEYSSSETEIAMTSYKSMENCVLTGSGDSDSHLGVECSGDHSCNNNLFANNGSIDISCVGLYSCIDSTFESVGNVDIECIGLYSCWNIKIHNMVDDYITIRNTQLSISM